jgi:thiamine kinase-like enzyme
MTALADAPRPSIDLPAMIAQIQCSIAEEKKTGYRARKASDVPVSVADVTAEWLTAVLCADAPGAAVEAVEVVGGSDGSTSRRALRLRYNDAGRKAGLPERLFGKATPTLQNRLICGLSGAMLCERDFYTILRPLLEIEAPVAYFAAADPETFRSIILFADMSENGTVFTNPYSVIDRAKAEDMVTLMATFHAKLWKSPLLARMTHLKTSLQFQEDVSDCIEFEERSNIGMDRAAAVIPASVRRDKHALWHEGLMPSLRINVRLPNTFTHCDVHIGNWYTTAAGRMGLTDWQCVSRGHGAGDIAYALSSALTIEDRRAWERDLVALYGETLKQLGVDDPEGTDNLWLRYRQQMFHALYNWVYTIGSGDNQPDMQPDDISMINIERMATAIEDLDSLDAVRTDPLAG